VVSMADRRRGFIRWCEGVENYEVRCHSRNVPAGTESERVAAPSKATLLVRGAGT
jgi:hypothetical protein